MTNVTESRTNGITLLPCPFCGGEAHIVQGINGYTQQNSDWMFGVQCDDCRGAVEQTLATEAEAIAAWNTRAERTCRYIERDSLLGTCSECGASMGDAYRYCRNCGAKVVE